ncbi:unnamed protein product [Cylicocyclus nassatus]|uniref:Neuropeptide-like protein 31 n=1 Tax=Cylicocyclus nassatus TaxID=53992 RepID=A0AA36H8Z7_CYLNA|nr:unnamed protein product [Cylicocyclus nassatus]
MRSVTLCLLLAFLVVCFAEEILEFSPDDIPADAPVIREKRQFGWGSYGGYGGRWGRGYGGYGGYGGYFYGGYGGYGRRFGGGW